MLAFSIQPETQVARLLLVHDAYVRARSRRRVVEHLLVILGGTATLLWFIPNPAPHPLRLTIAAGWALMLLAFGGSILRELVLRKRREELLKLASGPAKEV